MAAGEGRHCAIKTPIYWENWSKRIIGAMTQYDLIVTDFAAGYCGFQTTPKETAPAHQPLPGPFF